MGAHIIASSAYHTGSKYPKLTESDEWIPSISMDVHILQSRNIWSIPGCPENFTDLATCERRVDFNNNLYRNPRLSRVSTNFESSCADENENVNSKIDSSGHNQFHHAR